MLWITVSYICVHVRTFSLATFSCKAEICAGVSLSTDTGLQRKAPHVPTCNTCVYMYSLLKQTVYPVCSGLPSKRPRTLEIHRPKNEGWLLH